MKIISDRKLNVKIWEKNVTQIKKNILPAWFIIVLKQFTCTHIITSYYKNTIKVAFFLKIIPLTKTKHIARKFYLPEEGSQKAFSIREFFRRFALSKVSAFIVHSEFEKKYCSKRLKLSENKFHFIPFYSKIITEEELIEEDYIFAAGKYCRDFPLLSEAVSDLNIPCIIVSDNICITKEQIKSTTKVRYNIPFSDYQTLLKRCALVVVPIPSGFKKSVGQVALLEAMGHAKACIVADAHGLIDYVKDGENGLIYKSGDKEDLKEKILKLYNSHKLKEKIGKSALETAKSNTMHHFAYKVIKLISQL